MSREKNPSLRKMHTPSQNRIVALKLVREIPRFRRVWEAIEARGGDRQHPGRCADQGVAPSGDRQQSQADLEPLPQCRGPGRRRSPGPRDRHAPQLAARGPGPAGRRGGG